MNRPAARLLSIAALSSALAVLLGAFGAHALDAMLDERARGWWQTANQYHFWHSLGLAIVALTLAYFDGQSAPGDASAQPVQGVEKWLRLAAGLFLLGMLLFSGSLYLMAVSGMTALGMITPLGGVAMIAAWLILAMAAYRYPGDQDARQA